MKNGLPGGQTKKTMACVEKKKIVSPGRMKANIDRTKGKERRISAHACVHDGNLHAAGVRDPPRDEQAHRAHREHLEQIRKAGYACPSHS